MFLKNADFLHFTPIGPQATANTVHGDIDSEKAVVIEPEESIADQEILFATEVFIELKLAFQKLKERIATLSLFGNISDVSQAANIADYWNLFAGIDSMRPLLSGGQDPLMQFIRNNCRKIDLFTDKYTEEQIKASQHAEQFFQEKEEFLKLCEKNTFPAAHLFIRLLGEQVSRDIEKSNILPALGSTLVTKLSLQPFARFLDKSRL